VKAIDELTAAAPMFEGMSAEHLALIAGCGRNVRVPAGQILLREGDAADRFFLIRRGTVALQIHVPGRDPLVIETLEDGDTLGWSWLFEPYRWSLDARTVEPCALIAFDGACLRGKAEDDHELGYELMRRFTASLISRLQATRLQLLDVYGRA
jgi:CRP/FNR family transcriptional regulator, cyclic AMP receptor protein